MDYYNKYANRYTDAGAQSRVRNRIKTHLGWMSGFPYKPDGKGDSSDFNWVVVRDAGADCVETITLSGQHLNNAVYTVNKLSRDFPKALPKVVGDAETWKVLILRLVGRIKPYLHENKPLRQNMFGDAGIFSNSVCKQAGALAKQFKSLTPLLDALSWRYCTEPADMKPALAWIKQYGDDLSIILDGFPGFEGIALCVTLLHLTLAVGEPRTEPAVRFMGDPSAYGTWMSDGQEYAQSYADVMTRRQFRKQKLKEKLQQGIELPENNMAVQIKTFVYWLMEQDNKTKRRALELFGLVKPGDTVQAWAEFWPKFAKTISLARKKENAIAPGMEVPVLNKLRNRFLKLKEKTPLAMDFPRLMEVIRCQSEPANLSRYMLIVSMLKAVPAASTDVPAKGDAAQNGRKTKATAPHSFQVARARFLVHWDWMLREISGESKSIILHMLKCFSSYLREKPGEVYARLLPWEPVYGLYYYDQYSRSLDKRIASNLKRKSDVELFFKLVGMETRGMNEIEAGNLAWLLSLTGDPELSYQLIKSPEFRRGVDRHILNSTLKAAVSLSGGEPDFCWSIVSIIEEYINWGTNFGKILEKTADLFSAKGMPHVPPALIKAGLFGKIADCSFKLALTGLLIKNRDVNPPNPFDDSIEPVEADWLEHYPPVLREPLRQLARIHPGARKAAQRILSRDFSDPAAIKKQLDVLRQRLENEKPGSPKAETLEKRIIKLKTGPPKKKPSDERLQRLKTKLEHAVNTAVLSQWELMLDAAVRELLPAHVGINFVPDWMLETRNLQILGAIASLGPEHRPLAWKVLKERCGLPPWDLRDARENRGFLEDLRERGINTVQWLDGIGTIEYQTPGKRVLRLELEDDPLEIFLMGGHFKTCLSPGSMNFFSVFANAGDINKRVLYARDEQGRVWGRCLFGLTEEGYITAFHPYNHDSSMKFGDMVRDFAGKLAEKMNTVVVPDGEVDLLVADDWYDDGPVDMSNRFGFLNAGSKFRKSLKTVEPDCFVDELTRAAAPLALDELIIPMVLELDELKDRPKLVIPLLPYIENMRNLPVDALMKAALLLEEAGDLEKAGELFGHRAESWLLEQHRLNEYLNTPGLKFLLKIDPVRALAVLRKTREKGVRRWEDDDDWERLYFTAEAFDRLHRPKKAAALYRLAADIGSWVPQKKWWLKRADELENN